MTAIAAITPSAAAISTGLRSFAGIALSDLPVDLWMDWLWLDWAGSRKPLISLNVHRRAGSIRKHSRAMSAKGCCKLSGTTGSAFVARSQTGGR
jgi:hypothetical protein